MTDVNQVTITATVQECEGVRQFQNGRKISFRARVTREWRGQSYDTYIQVEAWNELADASLWLAPQMRVLVQGKLAVNSWQDQQGQKRSMVVVKAESIQQLAALMMQQPQPQAYGQPQTYGQYQAAYQAHAYQGGQWVPPQPQQQQQQQQQPHGDGSKPPDLPF